MEVLEADFCALGAYAVVQAVLEGKRSPRLLFNEIRCVCLAKNHTVECITYFHHQCIRLPTDLQVDALNRCYKERAALPAFANKLILTADANTNHLHTVCSSAWLASVHVRMLLEKRWSAVPVRVQLLAIPVISRSFSHPVITNFDDAVALPAHRAYHEWQTNHVQPGFDYFWVTIVIAIVMSSLEARNIPVELRTLIVAHLFTRR